MLETNRGLEAFQLMKRGILKGLSIGYDTIRDTITSGVRHLLEVKLYEVSLVTFPMNEAALVQSVKHSADQENWQIQQFAAMLRLCRESFR